jgi:tRNA G18 (ribose-2'-O)-methylase SpoU
MPDNPMINYSVVNLEIQRNSFNVGEQFKHMAVEDIRAYQNSVSKPWHVMALNVTGDLNVGVIARSASAFGCTSMWTVGRLRTDRRSYVGVEHYFKIHKVEGLKDDLTVDPLVIKDILDTNNLEPIFVEQGGININEIRWQPFIASLTDNGKKPLFVFGNEGLGIDPEILELGPIRISISQIGVTRSLNVAACASIVMHDFSSAMGWI